MVWSGQPRALATHRQGPRVQGRRSNNGLAAGKVASRELAEMVQAARDWRASEFKGVYFRPRDG